MPQGATHALTGLFFVVTRARGTTTKRGKALAKDAVVRAVGEVTTESWVPIVLFGMLDYVRRADVQKVVVPKPKKPTREQLAARRRLLGRKTTSSRSASKSTKSGKSRTDRRAS